MTRRLAAEEGIFAASPRARVCRRVRVAQESRCPTFSSSATAATGPFDGVFPA